MARTYRRKNARWAVGHEDYEFVKILSKYGGYYYEYRKMEENSKEYKRIWNRYHSDKNRTYNGPPSWFVNIYFQRPARREAKIALEQWKKGNKEQEKEVLLPKFRKCAGYDWW